MEHSSFPHSLALHVSWFYSLLGVIAVTNGCFNHCNDTVQRCSVCPRTLLPLECLQDEYVTGNISIGYRSGLSSGCCYAENDCLTHKTISIGPSAFPVTSFLYDCIWKQSRCQVQAALREIPIDGCHSLTQAYLHIENFRCIAASKAHKLTADPDHNSQVLVAREGEGFVLSPNFWGTYRSAFSSWSNGSRTTVTIKTSSSYKIDVKLLVADLPACDISTGRPVSGRDYLEIKSVQNNDVNVQWCGNSLQKRWTDASELRVSLVLGDPNDVNNNHGFVIQYNVVTRAQYDVTTAEDATTENLKEPSILQSRETRKGSSTGQFSTLKLIIITSVVILLVLLVITSIAFVVLFRRNRQASGSLTLSPVAHELDNIELGGTPGYHA